ncbi:MAG: hypothetical protein ACR2HR_18175 [Euzebya sp.]
MSAARRRRKGGQSHAGRRAPKKKPQMGFWGDASKLPEAKQDVRITTEAAVVPHSLGPPPLPGHETIAEHYFTAIYDKAVTLSGALAAAAGLIEPDDLVEELGD